MGLTIRLKAFNLADGKSIDLPFEMVNSGKTPAKGVHGSSVLVMLKRGEEPVFIYDPKRVRLLRMGSGILLPNLPEGRNLTVFSETENQ